MCSRYVLHTSVRARRMCFHRHPCFHVQLLEGDVGCLPVLLCHFFIPLKQVLSLSPTKAHSLCQPSSEILESCLHPPMLGLLTGPHSFGHLFMLVLAFELGSFCLHSKLSYALRHVPNLILQIHSIMKGYLTAYPISENHISSSQQSLAAIVSPQYNMK